MTPNPGYRFSTAGRAVSRQTIERWVARMAQRDERVGDVVRLGTYLERSRAVGIRESNQYV